jgi:mannosyltransferase OCH1-like enzyme
VIPKIIHQFWVGDKIPNQLMEMHETIVQTNPDWEVKLWFEDEIHEKLCRKQDYDLNPPQKSACVDVIKLYALRKYGGVVLDLDFNGIKSFDPILKYNAFYAKQPDGDPCNACYGSIAGHPWISRMMEDERSKWCSPNCCYIMESAAKGLSDVEVIPTDWLYPYNWNEEPKPHTENTIAIHLWEGSWIK